MVDVLPLTITVPFSYDVVFTRELLATDNPRLADFCRARTTGPAPARILVVVDQGVITAMPQLAAQLAAYEHAHADCLQLVGEPLTLPGGETVKNGMHFVELIVAAAQQAHLCRQSYIMAIGGGALLDAAGLAAALIHRGVSLIRVPTTVLSQNDSGIGVKNGVNLGNSKNFLGTFAPPTVVFNDCLFLRTLSDRDWIAGIAEAFKVAIVKDRDFLDWLIAQAPQLQQRHDPEPMNTLIQRCAQLHLEHISTAGDPFEFGNARPLDFGHWAAHKLESMTDYQLRHGEAVSIGMALDLLYAANLGMISATDATAVITALASTGLPLWHTAMNQRNASAQPLLFAGIDDFREHLGGELNLTLPQPLGAKIEVHSLDFVQLEAALTQLQALAQTLPGAQAQC